MEMFNWFMARLKEPSTALALAGFLAAAGLTFEEGVLSDALLGLAALAGVVAAFRKEGMGNGL